MKTTFQYFPGMFEDPAPAVKIICKRNINLKIKNKNMMKINYIRMDRKKIDDYRL